MYALLGWRRDGRIKFNKTMLYVVATLAKEIEWDGNPSAPWHLCSDPLRRGVCGLLCNLWIGSKSSVWPMEEFPSRARSLSLALRAFHWWNLALSLEEGTILSRTFGYNPFALQRSKYFCVQAKNPYVNLLRNQEDGFDGMVVKKSLKYVNKNHLWKLNGHSSSIKSFSSILTETGNL